MKRKLRYAMALLRGFLFSLSGKTQHNLSCGKKLLIFRQTEIGVRDHGKLTIGSSVQVGSGSVISALKQGQITLGDHVGVGRNCSIVCHQEVSVGQGTILAPNVMIYDHDHLFDRENGVDHRKFRTAPVHIGENCWIGANSIILRGTNIGSHCVVGAGSVIKGNFPDGSVIIQKRTTTIKEVE